LTSIFQGIIIFNVFCLPKIARYLVSTKGIYKQINIHAE